MENEFNITELFAVSLPEHNNAHFMGKLVPRKGQPGDKKLFGKILFDDNVSFICTTGVDRKEIERNSTELLRYSLGFQ
jgi:hypothetical protein